MGSCVRVFEVFDNRVENLHSLGTRKTSSEGLVCGCLEDLRRSWKVTTSVSRTSTASTTTSPEAGACAFSAAQRAPCAASSLTHSKHRGPSCSSSTPAPAPRPRGLDKRPSARARRPFAASGAPDIALVALPPSLPLSVLQSKGFSHILTDFLQSAARSPDVLL